MSDMRVPQIRIIYNLRCVTGDVSESIGLKVKYGNI